MDDLPERPPPPALTAESEKLRDAILYKLAFASGKSRATASDFDWYAATSHAVRDLVVAPWVTSSEAARDKRVYYFSVEFLIGRLLFDVLTNLRLTQTVRDALDSLGVDLDLLRKLEPDAALGNGGLGRLAACYMDSMAALSVPACGYGIRYEHGLFRQRIIDGRQHEFPETWLTFGNPWEFARPEVEYSIHFGGAVEYVGGTDHTARALWYPTETVLAVAYDTPIAGWRGKHVNTLRLWSARATSPIQLEAFNQGDYVGAMAARDRAEAISRVLYPSDETESGQELRLRQEYFFTSASLQDLVRSHLQQYGTLATLPDHAAIQLNDTHPAIAVAELMRLLIDEQDFSWKEAWRITTATLNYTNHTLLPEALESWPAPLLGRMLPRHLQIIYLINWRHLAEATEAGMSAEALSAVSIISEAGQKHVRMGHLAFVGSHRVNGVSALHTELMRKTVFRELEAASPGRIVNKTNGISFRRWLYAANPGLTALLTETLGEDVLDNPELLTGLEIHADDPGFVTRYAATRHRNKQALAVHIMELTGIEVDPAAMFDVQIKRMHEYKRQLLNVLETIALYHAICAAPENDWVPCVKIFAGKAAASYERAKLIIKLTHDVGRFVNADPRVGGRLKVVFIPNYSVSLAEEIIPAADLSEQISTAGLEASGTGNMKLALNGALTIGTLDGANIEMSERIGAENMFIFGMKAEEVAEQRLRWFSGKNAADASPRLAGVIESIASGAFSPEEPRRFDSIVQALLGNDRFMVAADFDSYWNAQRAVDDLWRRPQAWWKTSILNTARMGWFSSDRAIREYAADIWNVNVP